MTISNPDPFQDEPTPLKDRGQEDFDLIDDTVVHLSDDQIDERLNTVLSAAGYASDPTAMDRTTSTTVAGDDEDLDRRLAAPPPAKDLVVRAKDDGVALSWTPPIADGRMLSYRVVCGETAPRAPGDGDLIADVTEPWVIDGVAEPGRERHYAVFVSAGGDWSRPVTAAITVTPPVSAPRWSSGQQHRLMQEHAILARYYPMDWHNPTIAGATYVEGPLRTNSGGTYLVRIILPAQFPNECPDMIVVQPATLYDASGQAMTGPSALNRTLEAINGCTRISHFDPRYWTPRNTIYLVALKGRIWLEAYEAHRRSGRPLDALLPTDDELSADDELTASGWYYQLDPYLQNVRATPIPSPSFAAPAEVQESEAGPARDRPEQCQP